MTDLRDWMLASEEPWTRYGVLRDLCGLPADDPSAQDARDAMNAHPRIQELISLVGDLPWPPLKRHNDAKHPIHALCALADFGLRWDDPGLEPVVASVLERQSAEGALQTAVLIPKAFGGNDESTWTWLPCDAPLLLYVLLALGRGEDPRIEAAIQCLAGQVDENGWRCSPSPELGKFRGPGRKDDPCPIANLYALKAFALVPHLLDSAPVQAGIEMLLWHWEHQSERKLYLFGIGTDYRKLKYPFIWYDILHVLDVLSRFPSARADPRYREMLQALVGQADEAGRYTAASMYMAWRGWSFADKKRPSPWLTYLVERILSRDQTTG